MQIPSGGDVTWYYEMSGNNNHDSDCVALIGLNAFDNKFLFRGLRFSSLVPNKEEEQITNQQSSSDDFWSEIYEAHCNIHWL